MSSNVKSQIEDIEKESRSTGCCTCVQKHCFLMFYGTLSYSPWQEEPVWIALFNQQSFNEQSMVVPRQGRHPQVNFAQYQIPPFFQSFLGMCGMCSTFTNAIRAIHNKFLSGRKHSSHKKAKPKASARAAQGEISRSPSWLKFDILSAKVRKKAKIHTMPRWDFSICLFNSKCTANHPTNLEAPRFLQEALKCVHEVDLRGWRDSPWQLDHLLKYPW